MPLPVPGAPPPVPKPAPGPRPAPAPAPTPVPIPEPELPPEPGPRLEAGRGVTGAPGDVVRSVATDITGAWTTGFATRLASASRRVDRTGGGGTGRGKRAVERTGGRLATAILGLGGLGAGAVSFAGGAGATNSMAPLLPPPLIGPAAITYTSRGGASGTDVVGRGGDNRSSPTRATMPVRTAACTTAEIASGAAVDLVDGGCSRTGPRAPAGSAVAPDWKCLTSRTASSDGIKPPNATA